MLLLQIWQQILFRTRTNSESER